MSIDHKYKSVVHYVCSKCNDSSKLGATKLNKVLWYADTISYIQNGKTITGCKYEKMPFGPVPKEINTVVMSLKSEGKISVGESEFYGRVKKDYFSLSDPDLNVLEKNEIELLHDVIDFVCEKNTATSISALSHDIIWESASMGEDIPLEAILASQPGQLTKDDFDWANGTLERKGGVRDVRMDSREDDCRV